MPGLLDALRGRMKQRELNAIDTIAAAARAAARGEHYDVGAIETSLVEARLSMADFEAAVETATRRSTWLRDFEKLATTTNKVTKGEAAITVERDKFEAARQAFAEKVAAIDADLAAARTARDAGQAAKGNLLDPRHVPGTIGEKYRQAVADAEAADSVVAGIKRQLREITDRIKLEESWIVQLTGDKPKELRPFSPLLRSATPDTFEMTDHRNALARAQRKKAEADAQLVEADRASAMAKKAVEALIPDVLKA
jgi:hypothetical protein